MPALVKANRIQEKAAGVGFDWDNPQQVLEKVKEELGELEAERNAGNADAMESELGDVFFSLVNYARYLGINPENALERTNKKFIRRFRYLEDQSRADGKDLGTMSLEEMDRYWESAKELG